MLADKRTRAEAIRTLQSLRNKHAQKKLDRANDARRASEQRGTSESVTSVWQHSHGVGKAPTSGKARFLHVARANGKAARAAAKMMSQPGRQLDRYPVYHYPVLSEPSLLERQAGITSLGGIMPTGTEVETRKAEEKQRLLLLNEAAEDGDLSDFE